MLSFRFSISIKNCIFTCDGNWIIILIFRLVFCEVLLSFYAKKKSVQIKAISKNGEQFQKIGCESWKRKSLSQKKVVWIE